MMQTLERMAPPGALRCRGSEPRMPAEQGHERRLGRRLDGGGALAPRPRLNSLRIHVWYEDILHIVTYVFKYICPNISKKEYIHTHIYL